MVSALEPTQLLEHELNSFFHHPDLTLPVEHKRLALTEFSGSGDLDEAMIAIIHWKDKRSTDSFSEAVESWELIIVFALEAFLDVSDWDLAGDIVVDIDEALDHGNGSVGMSTNKRGPVGASWKECRSVGYTRICFTASLTSSMHTLPILQATGMTTRRTSKRGDDHTNTRIMCLGCACAFARIKAKQHSGQDLLKRLHFY